jgi:hypothetical protein
MRFIIPILATLLLSGFYIEYKEPASFLPEETTSNVTDDKTKGE